MSHTIANLLTKLSPDPWRDMTPFSQELEACNRLIFAAGEDRAAIRCALNDWLRRHQPCLFGRLAARQELLGYCILSEADLSRSDEAICEQIQEARTHWTAEGFAGKKSGFIVLAVSPRLARAVPDRNLRALAEQLCSLYLIEPPEISVDSVYHDAIFLEKPGSARMTWKWLAGVNYFCSNADGRWWHDHRIPGGLAFSVNSVGHLAKTGAFARELERGPEAEADSLRATQVDSLEKALEFAMRTIALAADAVSGKATELLPLSTAELPSPRCPITLPSFLEGKDFRSYQGYYHTDYTLPAEYFLPDVERPAHCQPRRLEFTYLFDGGGANPDYVTMGAGRRVRGDSEKPSRMQPLLELIEDNPRLIQALSSR